jgi:hypothetical protein
MCRIFNLQIIENKANCSQNGTTWAVFPFQDDAPASGKTATGAPLLIQFEWHGDAKTTP